MTRKTSWLSGLRRQGARIAGASLLLALGLGGCGESPDTEAQPQSPVTPGQQAQAASGPSPLIRGYLATRVGNADQLPRRDIHLPGMKVYARDVSTGATVGPDITDLSGRFTLPVTLGSTYEICWEAAGYHSGCDSKKPATISAPLRNVGTVLIPANNPLGTAVVWGNVSMADGSAVRKFSPEDNVNAFAQVQLLDKNGTAKDQVFVNNFGEYIFTQVPEGDYVSLRAFVEGAEGVQAIQPDANLGGRTWHQINLSIANTPPRLKPIIATDSNGRWAKAAATGATVYLKAESEDKEGDALQYRWSLSPGNGSLDTTSGTAVKWTLPTVRGLWTARVLVWDGRGGYAEQTFSIRTDGAFVLFSGTVTDQAGAALSAVRVEIITPAGTTTTTTNTAGFFRVFARDADRYVFNLRKTGYGYLSEIHDGGITGGRWKMQRATVRVVNPTLAIDITNERSSTECPGRLSEQLDWTGKYASALTPQWQDGKGNVVAPPKEQGSLPLPNPKPPRPTCGPGMRVQIPANALVDSLGRAPTGNVEIAVTTIDLKSMQMPGDFTTRALDGQMLVAQSYGAGTVEIYAGSTKYNLRPGVTATVSIPVDPTQLAAGGVLPTTIPVLYFDEVAGIWKEELKATLNSTRTAYVVQAPHFSVINMDLVKTNPACVRIDATALADGLYDLEVAIPMPGAAPVFRRVPLDNSLDDLHALYNLPTNTDIVVVPVRKTGNVPVGTFVVNTGGPQNPSTPNAPAAPYGACANELRLQERVLPAPVVDFLHGLNTFDAINLDELDPADPTQTDLKNRFDESSTNYYRQTDPRDLRTTLTAFITHNGFSSEVRAAYANAVDLGLGRDMHCSKRFIADSGRDAVACYVRVYGDIDSDHVADAEEARLGGVPRYTLAMEYSPTEAFPDYPTEFEDTTHYVKFYVYDAAGNRVRSVNLDKRGERPVPAVCMSCHGGVYSLSFGTDVDGVPYFPDRPSTMLGSQFLPFDLRSFEFSATPGFGKVDLQDEFKRLNQEFVKAANDPATPTPVTELVDGWYAGGSATQVETFVAAGWNSSTEPLKLQAYRDLVGKACRTCHVAQPDPNLAFNTATQFISRLGVIESRVCGQHSMPHSKRGHDSFWSSFNPHQPGVLQSFGATYGTSTNGWDGTLCTNNPSSGAASTYTDLIQPIWNRYCTSCHQGGSPPAGLTLATGVSRADLFLVPSSQLGTMMLVQPGDSAMSYLWHKLNNTHVTVGGFGNPMPSDNTYPVSPAELGSIQIWINTGATP